MQIPGSNKSDKAQAILQRFSRAKASRVNWESYWQEVSEYVSPNMSHTYFEGGYAMAPGMKKDQKRFDGAAEIALFRFAAAMESFLTPRNSLWHGLTTNNKQLNKMSRVREYFDDVRDVLFKYRYDPKANFASQCHEHYMQIGLVGTACMFLDKLQPRGFRYSQIHVAQVYFYENHQGVINEAIRPFRLTARQAVEKFGEKNLPDAIVKASKENSDQNFDFVHCVCPNEDRDSERKDYRGMEYASYYISKEGCVIVEEDGYNSFPYMVSRYVTVPGEIYGRSPAMQALTNIKVLNNQKRTVLKQGHRITDPVLLTHDDGVIDGFSMKPGSLNPGTMTADGKRLVDILPTGSLAVGDKMMQMERDEIAAAFMTDLFQIFMDRPQMTATEIMELAREKGVLFSPTMGRQETEFLGRMIEREIDLATMQGLLPPMPQELIDAGGEYEIVYENPLSRAQRAEQAAGLMRTVSWAAELAAQSQDPAPLDHFNWDVIIPELSQIQAVPARWMKSEQQLEDLRSAREQAMAQQQVIEAGPTIAALAKNR